MNSTQCSKYEDYCCEEPHCLSRGVDCEDHEEETFTCKTGTEHLTSTMSTNYLRWDCKDKHWNTVDIYNGTVKAPGGTRCTARPE